MPILSLNFGIACVRSRYIDDSGISSSFVYKYPYSENLYSHFYSEHDFYSDVIDVIIKELGVITQGLKIIATGFPKIPSTKYPYDNSILFDQLIKGITNYEIVSITDSTVFTHNKYSATYDIEKLQYGKNEKNYLLNLSLYNNVIPETPSEYNLILANIWNMFNALRTDTKTLIMTTKPMVFMGDVFDFENVEFEEIAYLYILSFIANPGMYTLNLDKKSELVHLAHLKIYKKEMAKHFEEFSPIALGTLINSPGETTCLIKNESGSNQLLEIKPGKIFLVPMPENMNTKVIVKSKYFNSVEKTTRGGKLGLIIDTRAKQEPQHYDYNQLQIDINTNLKGIREALRIL